MRAGIPRPEHKDPKRPKQAIVVMPQWNADAFSHNSLCTIFNRMGISALRLSKPYHDIRRPVELERSDYAVSANIGRTLSACRQAVVDIRCCIDWLEEQGYEHFGVLGTSLGSCYAFLASTHDHAHPRQRFQPCVHGIWRRGLGGAKHAPREAGARRRGHDPGPRARVVVGHQSRQLLRPDRKRRSRRPGQEGPDGLRQLRPHLSLEYSLQVVEAFKRVGLNFEKRVLPCGHYTTGETPFKYIDGWYMGSFVYRAFKALRREKAERGATAPALAKETEADLVSR